jgi:hypothetical protein
VNPEELGHPVPRKPFAPRRNQPDQPLRQPAFALAPGNGFHDDRVAVGTANSGWGVSKGHRYPPHRDMQPVADPQPIPNLAQGSADATGKPTIASNFQVHDQLSPFIPDGFDHMMLDSQSLANDTFEQHMPCSVVGLVRKTLSIHDLAYACLSSSCTDLCEEPYLLQSYIQIQLTDIP